MSINRLEVRNNTNIEKTINFKILDFIYSIIKENNLEDNNISGLLNVKGLYKDAYDYLTEHNNELTINILSYYYIRFECSAIENILANKIGDGTGVPISVSNTLQPSRNIFNFYKNNEITSFMELSQFTNFTKFAIQLGDAGRGCYVDFNNCNNLTKLDLSNFTEIGGSYGYQRENCENCSNLETVITSNKLKFVGYQMFCNCSKLTSIDLSSVETICAGAFYECTSLTSIGSLNNIKYLDRLIEGNTYNKGNSSFESCKNVQEFIHLSLPNLEIIGLSTFVRCTQIETIDDLGKLESIPYSSWTWGPFWECPNIKYAIFPSTCNYVGVNPFNSCSKLKYIKLLYEGIVDIYEEGGKSGWNSHWNNNGTYDGQQYDIYVPDTVYDDYLNDEFYSRISWRIKKMSTFDESLYN